MTISKNIEDREKDKFEENSDDGGTDVRAVLKNTTSNPVPTTSVPDTTGTTIHIVGTATTTPTDFPASAGNDITLALISNLESKKTRDVQYSFDGGTTFSTLKPGSFVGWPTKGDLKQVKIKRGPSAVVDVSFDMILNRKP